MEYKIKFEFFGKKMQTTIQASSKDEAIEKLKDRIDIHSVDIEPINPNQFEQQDFFDNLKNIMGIK